MIIMNQNRDLLLNVASVQTIYAYGNLVRADLQDGKLTLGEYADEDQAKDVLCEIMAVYASYKHMPGGPLGAEDIYIQPLTFVPPKVYKMPEE